MNLRGYPGKTAIPKTCQDVKTVNGKTYRKKIPCFQDPRGTWRSDATGITATMYTVNHGADSWHVLFAWRRDGSLYTISEHVAPPLSFSKVVANLKRMIDGLVLVRPRLMGLTRRQALAGTAGAIAGAAGIYALVDRHAALPSRAAGAVDAPSRAAPARRRPGRHRQRRRGARAAAPSRGRDRHRGTRPISSAAQRDLERGAGRARGALPRDTGRARDHGRVGIAVLPALRPRAVGTAAAGRRPCPDAGVARRDPVLE